MGPWLAHWSSWPSAWPFANGEQIGAFAVLPESPGVDPSCPSWKYWTRFGLPFWSHSDEIYPPNQFAILLSLANGLYRSSLKFHPVPPQPTATRRGVPWRPRKLPHWSVKSDGCGWGCRRRALIALRTRRCFWESGLGGLGGLGGEDTLWWTNIAMENGHL